MNMWNDLKQIAWSQISLNIVTLHYENSRAQSVFSCQTFFTDENTLFMVKGSMENQFWASISFLLRKRNLPGNREDFAGPLTKMATDLDVSIPSILDLSKLAISHEVTTLILSSLMPYLTTNELQLYVESACWVKGLKFLFGPNAGCIIIDYGCHFFNSQKIQFIKYFFLTPRRPLFASEELKRIKWKNSFIVWYILNRANVSS